MGPGRPLLFRRKVSRIPKVDKTVNTGGMQKLIFFKEQRDALGIQGPVTILVSVVHFLRHQADVFVAVVSCRSILCVWRCVDFIVERG